MNTCKTCKHHKQSGDNDGGWCECPKIHEPCNTPEGEHTWGNDHLVYSYNEGGSFWTGNDFGCVHHTLNRCG